MRTAFRLLILAATLLAAPFSHATSYSIDHSDLWGVANESGWGIQFVQQDNTIFATMFVYGADNQPTWYIATLTPTTNISNYAGQVYKVTGPYFGGAWDPTQAHLSAPLGLMTFYAQYIEQGELNYTISGEAVHKTISRATFTTEHLGGTYIGGANLVATSGDCTGFSIGPSLASGISISETGPATVDVLFSDGVPNGSKICLVTGATVVQNGQFSSVSGAYTCANNDKGTLTFSEAKVSYGNIVSKVDRQSSVSTCHQRGYFAGVRQ